MGGCLSWSGLVGSERPMPERDEERKEREPSTKWHQNHRRRDRSIVRVTFEKGREDGGEDKEWAALRRLTLLNDKNVLCRIRTQPMGTLEVD